MNPSAEYEWSVCIISSRESLEVLDSAVRSAILACRSKRALVDVIVNGNDALASAMAALAGSYPAVPASLTLRVWRIALGDKANAWNVHAHELAVRSGVVFFVDGYAQVAPNAFNLIQEAFIAHPDALAVTGVPTSGRSAARSRAEMLTHGGIHGNLFAVRGEVVQEIRARRFRLPVGLYRTDGTIGAALAFGLDPAKNDWNIRRIYVHPEATWTTARSPARISAQLKRMLRQAQGILENLAIRQRFAAERRPLEDLPAHAVDLVAEWVATHPMQTLMAGVRNPLCWYALLRLRARRRVEPSAAQLLAQI